MQSLSNQNNTRAATSNQHSTVLWKSIWAMKIEPKIKSFLWSICHNALASKANLFQRHIITNPICHLCQQNVPETLEHIFVQ